MPSTATPSYAVGVGDAVAPRGDLNRLLGPEAGPAAVVQPAAASRFALSGVLSPKEGYAGSAGVALIAVDGRPARAYQVGARLVDDYVLQGVTRRTASLGGSQAGSAAVIVLELPERPAPATGTLPQTAGVESGTYRSPGAAMAPAMQAQQPVQQPVQPVPVYSPPPMQAPELQVAPPSAPPQDLTPPADGSGTPGPTMGQGPPRRAAPGSR